MKIFYQKLYPIISGENTTYSQSSENSPRKQTVVMAPPRPVPKPRTSLAASKRRSYERSKSVDLDHQPSKEIYKIVPLRFKKAGRVCCGGARETH